jgi:DNA-binding transcriptional LysR family regulator
MDPQQLSAFIAVAETGSFTRAANRLHLTQPAISKRIYLLEGYLGNSLFDRIGKRVNLTEAGRVLLPHAHKILRDIEDTSIALQNLSDSVSGRLILASSHHVGLHRLPPILKQFSAQFPDVLMSSKEHPLSAYNRISLEDLLNFPAILPGQDTFTRLLIEDVFLSADLKLEVEMSTNYLETIKMMVSVGMAWSILPKTMCDDTLKILKIKGLKLERELGTIVHSEHTLSNAAEAFISVLEQHSTL